MKEVPYYILKLSPSELLLLVNALRLASITNKDYRNMLERLNEVYRNEFKFIKDDGSYNEEPS